MLEGQDAIQRDLDRLGREGLCQLHEVQQHQMQGLGQSPVHGWMDGWMESSSVEKDFEVLFDKKLDMSQPHALRTQIHTCPGLLWKCDQQAERGILSPCFT